VDGEEDEQQFFVKLVEREEWFEMAEAEYEGQKALAALIPDNVVAPLAWGPLQRNKTQAFFMTKFRNLRARSPPVEPLLQILKRLHEDSVSPTGQFGFHITTYFGPPPMINDWTDSWEEYFGRQWLADIGQIHKAQGEDPELQAIAEEFVQKVIARLLRPLQTGGRNIKPSLCHGDLWDGNVQMDIDTQQPIIFDAVCFYGHNEADLQCMGSTRYALGMDFVELYMKEVGASEPQKDFYDRHKLYAMRADVVTAAIFPQWAHIVQKCKDDMRELLDKYPNGYADFVEEEDDAPKSGATLDEKGDDASRNGTTLEEVPESGTALEEAPKSSATLDEKEENASRNDTALEEVPESGTTLEEAPESEAALEELIVKALPAIHV
jgi:protein-ribulosamine 3-kinase